MKFGFLTAMVIVGALAAGCDNNREDVRDARNELTETQREAAQDVQKAQAEAVKDVNDTKEAAADDVNEAQRDLQKAEAKIAEEGTASGATSSAGEVSVTPEQCARFAVEKNVKPEDRAAYEACAKMDKDKLAK